MAPFAALPLDVKIALAVAVVRACPTEEALPAFLQRVRGSVQSRARITALEGQLEEATQRLLVLQFQHQHQPPLAKGSDADTDTNTDPAPDLVNTCAAPPAQTADPSTAAPPDTGYGRSIRMLQSAPLTLRAAQACATGTATLGHILGALAVVTRRAHFRPADLHTVARAATAAAGAVAGLAGEQAGATGQAVLAAIRNAVELIQAAVSGDSSAILRELRSAVVALGSASQALTLATIEVLVDATHNLVRRLFSQNCFDVDAHDASVTLCRALEQLMPRIAGHVERCSALQYVQSQLVRVLETAPGRLAIVEHMVWGLA